MPPWSVSTRATTNGEDLIDIRSSGRPPPDLSVVVVESGNGDQLPAVLAALGDACRGLRAEFILVADDAAAPRHLKDLPVDVSFRAVTAAAETLAPVRWGTGLSAAEAPLVAFTTTEFLVHPSWARKLLKALSSGTVGAAGGIELAPGSSSVAAATYLLRYSAFMPRDGGPLEVPDIPGDTALYRREALQAHADLLRRGFWEVEFHRRFASLGQRLVFVPEPLASYHGRPRLVRMMQQRFRHARAFGWTRVNLYGASRWRVVAPAPLVPLVLVARIARRTAALGRSRLFWGSAPALFALSCAWAAGEVIGALFGPGSD